MTHGTKSSVFFNIVQGGGEGSNPFCCRFCIIMDAMWQYNPQYNPQHKCSKRGGEGGVKGRLNNVQKTDEMVPRDVPKRDYDWLLFTRPIECCLG